MNFNEETKVSTDIKSILGIIIFSGISVWTYSTLVEKLNVHQTKLEIIEKDLTLNNDFRIKWPRGQLGDSPSDSKQFLLIDSLTGQFKEMQHVLQSMVYNKVILERMQKDMEKAQVDIQVLKDD